MGREMAGGELAEMEVEQITRQCPHRCGMPWAHEPEQVSSQDGHQEET